MPATASTACGCPVCQPDRYLQHPLRTRRQNEGHVGAVLGDQDVSAYWTRLVTVDDVPVLGDIEVCPGDDGYVVEVHDWPGKHPCPCGSGWVCLVVRRGVVRVRMVRGTRAVDCY